MPYRIDAKKDGKFHLYNLDKKQYAKKAFKTKQAATNMAKRWMDWRYEKPVVRGNKVIKGGMMTMAQYEAKEKRLAELRADHANLTADLNKIYRDRMEVLKIFALLRGQNLSPVQQRNMLPPPLRYIASITDTDIRAIRVRLTRLAREIDIIATELAVFDTAHPYPWAA